MRQHARPFLLAGFALVAFAATATHAALIETPVSPDRRDAQKTRPLDPPLRPGEAGPVRGTPGGGAPVGRGARGMPADAVSVTVNYDGKGDVSVDHEIVLLLYGTPSFEGLPIATQIVEKNGATAVFRGLRGGPYYVEAVYDETGTYHGAAAPPPELPMAVFAHDAKSPPQGIKPGQSAVKLKIPARKPSGRPL